MGIPFRLHVTFDVIICFALESELLVMRQISVSAINATCIFMMWTGFTVAVEPTECQRLLVPLHAPKPDYPSYDQASKLLQGTSYMHVFVEGHVTVKYTVATSGTVEDVQIMESSNNLVGPNRNRYPPDYFSGFLEMNVVPTVSLWKYQPISRPCEAQNTFTYVLDSDA